MTDKPLDALESQHPSRKPVYSRKRVRPPRIAEVLEDWDDAEDEHRTAEQPAWPWWAFI